MLKIKIDSWELPTLAKNHPETYTALYEAASKLHRAMGTTCYMKPLDQLEKDEKGEYKRDYGNQFEAFITSADDLPPAVLNFVKWEHQPLLKFMKDDNPAAIHARSVQDALQLHQVHLPDMMLLTFDQVMVMENECTERLQEQLKEGWRIIAVCPQSGQRRPDYVLGRSSVAPIQKPAAAAGPFTQSDDIPY